MFRKGSRYQKVKDEVFVSDQGEEQKYKRTRFIPENDASREHEVIQGERLDLIAYRYYKDPTKFWLICDANGASHPAELEIPGKRILIPPDR